MRPTLDSARGRYICASLRIWQAADEPTLAYARRGATLPVATPPRLVAPWQSPQEEQRVVPEPRYFVGTGTHQS